MPLIHIQTNKNIYLRYMIVENDDLLRDLKYWETLSISSLMLRPVRPNYQCIQIEVVYNDAEFTKDEELQEAFIQNRVSALSLALLTSESLNTSIKQEITSEQDILGCQESTIYRNILDLTKYKSRGLRLIDYEDTELVVENQFDEYASIYRPLLQDHEPFKSCVNLVARGNDEEKWI